MPFYVMGKKIVVVTIADEIVSDYVALLWTSLLRFSVLGCPRMYSFESINHEHNSMRHGLALNGAVEELKEEDWWDILVVVDADICVLYKGWDEVFVREFENKDVFGLQSPVEYHRSAENFPGVFMVGFTRKALNRWTPDFTPKLVDGQESVARVGKIKCDTGWKMQRTMAGAKAVVIPYLPALPICNKLLPIDKRTMPIVKQKPTHQAEWHYNGKLFATHKQACRNHRLNGRYGAAWKRRIDLYTQKEYGITL